MFSTQHSTEKKWKLYKKAHKIKEWKTCWFFKWEIFLFFRIKNSFFLLSKLMGLAFPGNQKLINLSVQTDFFSQRKFIFWILKWRKDWIFDFIFPKFLKLKGIQNCFSQMEFFGQGSGLLRDFFEKENFWVGI